MRWAWPSWPKASRPRPRPRRRNAWVAPICKAGCWPGRWRPRPPRPCSSSSHELAHADRATGPPGRVELQAALLEQHHHRGAEQEAAHLLTLGQRDLTGGVVPGLDAAAALDAALPDRGHAADDGGPHQHQHPAAEGVVVEHAHHALVARKQPRHAARRGRVHREQRARHMQHAHQPAGGGHVDAVVVARAQVEVGEQAVLEARGQLGIATDEGGGREGLALGLVDLIALDASDLADGAVHRADQRRLRQRPRAGLQRPGEEVVEGLVGSDVRLGRLGHVDAVARDEAADGGGRQRSHRLGRIVPGQARHRELRHQVLRQDFESIRHGIGAVEGRGF
mmetsp:Transcript_6377/g.11456  ORF Transcript_6377/g.11456 Transcript_6377/m.11456 type:complete len:337 (-) Transcript_6377:154-1164(-)